MNFTQLPISEHFEFEGDTYIKTSALLARNTRTGQQRMIPRSVEVRTDAPAPPEHADTVVSAEEVRGAFEAYHASCMDALYARAAPLDPATLSALEQAFESARQRFLTALAENAGPARK